MKYIRRLISGVLAFLFLTCVSFADEQRSIILQSTTSTRNSGLFDHILPMFTATTGIKINVVAVGTGQALKNGRKGDGDVLLVHALKAEEEFVREGYGVKRQDVMYNDFIIVGPQGDPAQIVGVTNILQALDKIAASQTLFISRGDSSGTHQKERALWQMLGKDVASESGGWYRESGSGMGATLNIAVGMGAYTLTDRSTWIAFQNRADFEILSEGDPLLFNQYGVIQVNPARHPHVKSDEGNAFISWLTGKPGQAAINSYQLDGQQLFFANAEPATN